MAVSEQKVTIFELQHYIHEYFHIYPLTDIQSSLHNMAAALYTDNSILQTVQFLIF